MSLIKSLIKINTINNNNFLVINDGKFQLNLKKSKYLTTLNF